MAAPFIYNDMKRRKRIETIISLTIFLVLWFTLFYFVDKSEIDEKLEPFMDKIDQLFFIFELLFYMLIMTVSAIIGWISGSFIAAIVVAISRKIKPIR